MNITDLSDIVKVTAAILVKDNKIIIAKRGPDDRLAHKWEFPGGKVEAGEALHEALARELLEELGLADVDIGDQIGVGPWPLDDGAVMSVFVVDIGDTHGPEPRDDHDEVRWLTVEDAFSVAWIPADRPIVDRIVQRLAER